MGRTSRKRQKIKNQLSLKRQNNHVNLMDMENWMKSLGWSPVYKLIPHVFKDTGRGLMCLEQIETNTAIIKIPKKLLITIGLVCQTNIKNIFDKKMYYDAQTVLAVFLSYEKHIDSLSDWKIYIDSLPLSYTVPDYCSYKEKLKLPNFINDELEPQSRNLINQYKLIIQSINKLDDADKICNHCGELLINIINFNLFKWAFYTVNTRAVYIDTLKSTNNYINIKNSDNLGLAPFLDLFNHSYDASVDVNLIMDNNNNSEYYQIITLNSFNKNSQVFINYGSHSSLKLYLEYGFFIPNNSLDEVYIDYDDVKKIYHVNKNDNEFIITNGFHKNIGFTCNNLNYNAKILLFILTSTSNSKNYDFIRIKIYSNEEFNSNELFNINYLANKLIVFKKKKLNDTLNNMSCVINKTESFKMAINLINEHLKILDNCLNYLKKKID